MAWHGIALHNITLFMWHQSVQPTRRCSAVQDIRYFFILLGILYGGFAIAFNMQLGGDSDESQPTALYLFTTMVGDFSSAFVLGVLQDEGQW